MSLLYQPVTRNIMQRTMPGCLTPSNQVDTESNSSWSENTSNSKQNKILDVVSEAKGTGNILSPPLSPYQRTSNEDVGELLLHKETSYISSKSPFKIEDFKSYELTLSPWNGLSKNYKRKHMDFLEQYSTIMTKENVNTFSERRPVYKRRHIINSDSDSESAFERMRTRRIAKEKTVEFSELESSKNSSPSPKKRKTSKPVAVQQQAFIDENIPDYSPSLTTLPKGNNRCLKVEWKGQPMDLREDPNLDKLHPAEVLLASILRLPCNVYLDSKRRLFFEKVNRLKNGMQFRRTDAQKACRIDVNKASRLYAAYEKAGWLKDHHFTKFL